MAMLAAATHVVCRRPPRSPLTPGGARGQYRVVGIPHRVFLEFLVENYRSSRHIIDAASRCIEGAAERLKRDHRLQIDTRRFGDPPGGRWAARDSIAAGKVEILNVKGGLLSQAVVAVEELKRLSELEPDWQWSRCAIIARNWAISTRQEAPA